MRQAEASHRAPMGQFLRDHAEDILADWEERARGLPRAATLPHPLLLDHLPILLADMAKELDERTTADSPLTRSATRKHDLDRLGKGFDLPELVREYSLLRDCILTRWERFVRPQEAGEWVGLAALNRVMDIAVARAIRRYTAQRDRTLQALDHISLATFESRDLDDLLERLLAVLLQSTPAVDTGVILLREGDILRVRAVAGLDREPMMRLSMHIGEGFSGTVAQRREPMYLFGGSKDPLLKGDALRGRGLRSLYGIPLIDGGDLIGVTHMGSVTAQEFSDEDKRLLSALGARASASLYQHLLRAKLANQEERLRLSLEASGQGSWDWNLDAGTLTWDEQCKVIFGMSPDADVTFSVFLDHVHPDDRLLVQASIDASIDPKGDGSYAAEFRTVAAGSAPERWVMSRGRTEFDGEKPVRMLGTARDISERKRYEMELRSLSEASRVLATSMDYEQTLQTVTRLAVPDIADWCAVALLRDEELELVAAAHVDAEEVDLIHELWHRYPPPLNPGSKVPSVLRSGKPVLYSRLTDDVLGEVARDETHLAMLQRLFKGSAMLLPLRVRGQTLGILTLVTAESGRHYHEHDVTFGMELARRAALAADNARLYREAQDSLRWREDILAVVSHDLRNPLGAVELAAEIIAAARDEPEQIDKQIGVIRRTAARMERLLSDLLDTSSIQAGRFSIDLATLDAGALCREACELGESKARERDIVMRCRVRDGLLVECDRARILQVLSNLIGNAVKFCGPGNHIEVTAAREGKDVLISVADDGPGIPEHELERIFEPYWSGEHEAKGTGLGLFISWGIVRAHGGRMWAESAPGEGARFFFTLRARERRD